MGDPSGIGGFRGGKPNIKQIVKKKIGRKILKIGEIRKKKNRKNLIFFFTENGLNALGTPRNTFKSQQSV